MSDRNTSIQTNLYNINFASIPSRPKLMRQVNENRFKMFVLSGGLKKPRYPHNPLLPRPKL